MSPIQAIRYEAKSRGLIWSAVHAMYQELKSNEQEARRHPNDVRSTAWMFVTANTPGSWDFWRHGFSSRWGRRVAQRDYTLVPGYDELGQEIATVFPEYSGDNGTARLFDFLFSPYEKMPNRESLYRDAMDEVERQTTAIPVPF